MIVNELYPTAISDNAGNEYTDRILNIPIEDPDFTNGYWLGWLKWENLPSAYNMSLVTKNESQFIITSKFMVKENLDIGYLSKYTSNAQNGMEMQCPSLFQYDKENNKWTRFTQSNWDDYTGVATNDSALPNKVDINTTNTIGVFLGFSTTFQSTLLENSTGQCQSGVVISIQDFINKTGNGISITPTNIWVMNGSQPNISWTIPWEDLDGKVHAQKINEYYVSYALTNYYLAYMPRAITPTGGRAGYLENVPMIRIHVETNNTIYPFIIGAPGTTIGLPTTYLRGGGYTYSFNDGFFYNIYDNYSIIDNIGFYPGGWEGIVAKADVANRIRNTLKMWQPEGCNFLFQGTGRNDTCKMRRIFTYKDVYKHLALQARHHATDTTNSDDVVYENSDNYYYAAVSDKNEFLAKFYLGQTNKSKLREWQLINSTISPETANYDAKDKPEYDAIAEPLIDYWNESVEDLTNDYFDLEEKLREEELPIIETKNGKVITTKEIQDANAGYIFDQSIDENEDWVEPGINIDGEYYKNIRGIDKTISVLANAMNLHFAHTQQQIDRTDQKNWIRLIMPKYSRRVEIEDLNRNFWIIAQVIAAACSWLLDDGKPISNLLKQLINEIVQLWENVLYLWATMAAQEQKNNDNIHIEMLPVPASIVQNYNKYDFYGGKYSKNPLCAEDYFYTELYKKRHDSNVEIFSDYAQKKDSILQTIEDKIDFLRRKYKNQNLCIIPYYRIDNYEENYYSAMVIPAIFTYHQGAKEWDRIELYNSSNIGPASITVDSGFENQDYSDYLYAIKENRDNISYNYFTPLSSAKNRTGAEDDSYYGIIRVIPHLYLKLTPTKIVLDNKKESSFEIIDAAEKTYQSMTGTGSPYLDNSSRQRVISNINGKYELLELALYQPMPKTDKILSFSEDKNRSNNSAYYMGELISYKRILSKPVIQNGEFRLVKIGDFYPSALVEGKNKTSKVSRANFTLIGALSEDTDSYGTEKVYDSDTYGIGAYHLKVNREKMALSSGKVVFFNYNYFYVDKMEEGDNSKYYKPIFYAEELTPILLTQLSIRYIKHLRNDKEPNNQYANEPSIAGTVILGADTGKAAIYATKIGCTYWTGNAGPQWNSGIVTNLVYASGDTDASGELPISITQPFLFDGYWTRNDQVFSLVGGRWRDLSLTCKGLTLMKENDNIIVDMIDGQLVWYDHNKTVYPEKYKGGDDQKPSNRPHCSIDINSNNVVSFGTGWAPATYANLIKDGAGKINMTPQIIIKNQNESFINAGVSYNLGTLTSSNSKTIYKNGFSNATYEKDTLRGIAMSGANDVGAYVF